jgi:[glutamine synthetase] adenylyltransferase / [glutamine synthetase]-adenylyl-L-tyrosine phosphorylase
MKEEQTWKEAIADCAAPERARHYLSLVQTGGGGDFLAEASAEQARILCALFSGSQFWSELLAAHPEWLANLTPELLGLPRQKQGFQREMQGWLGAARQEGNYAAGLRKTREFKQKEMLRIAARDLAGLGKTTEIIQEITDVADACLEVVLQICWDQLTGRQGSPWHQNPEGAWEPTPFCILGMGKLGGQELNYSSDVDLLFVYAEEGTVFKSIPKGQGQGKISSNHQFFTRLAEALIAELSRMTPEGMLFRIDMRLRPEGKAGPLVRSLGSYENYYAQWGQTWERMMLIKARLVAGDQVLGGEFLEMIQPFRYPRSVSQRIVEEISGMKQRIETEVIKAGEIERNIKLGRGGIREIEFIAQTLQVLHGGRIPFLQGAQTLAVLEKCVQYELLPQEEVKCLSRAYLFFRNLEHRLQMENNLQTHTLPAVQSARERLARLMGFGSREELEAARQRHADEVRAIYDRLIQVKEPQEKGLPLDFEAESSEWKECLARHSIRDVEHGLRLAQTFIQGPGYVHVSSRTVELGRRLFQQFLSLCPRKDEPAPGSGEERLSDPDRVLARLDSFISVYGARSMLYETWTSSPSLFRLLLLLFDRSEFLAEIAIRTPDLVDELELSGRLRRRKSAEEVLKDLLHGIKDKDQHLWLRRYHQTELMRIGLRDILGLADFEQNLVELSALADACLQYALEVILKKYRLKKPPFIIVGLGKLGGAELNYGSDLDIMFVTDSSVKRLPELQRMAVSIIGLLSAQTEMGAAFVTDTRLRPDGEKGLLVNTLKACRDYYCQRGQLWEIQSLSRTRPIAGDPRLGGKFQELAASLSNFSQPLPGLAAYTPNWKQEIVKMRRRIEKERTPAGKQALAIKTGAGGLMDAEFIAQVLCLEHGWRQPNTLRALEQAREDGVLPVRQADPLIENYRKLRRIEGILRRWSFAGETVLPDDPAPLYRVAVRCGFRDAETFMKWLGECRRRIRKVYQEVMEFEKI